MSEPDYGAWISTYTNKHFALLRTTVDMIDILDIAHGLSMICRFGGHTKKFYSVAQHSLIVSQLCPDEYKLEGLMHDATEAYMGDMVRPLKQLMPEYISAENKLHDVINKKYKLKHNKKCKKQVKVADNIALVTEKRDLKNHELWDYLNNIEPANFKIKPWGPSKAEREFLKRFEELTNGSGTKRS